MTHIGDRQAGSQLTAARVRSGCKGARGASSKGISYICCGRPNVHGEEQVPMLWVLVSLDGEMGVK